jgi:hypothetical protein
MSTIEDAIFVKVVFPSPPSMDGISEGSGGSGGSAGTESEFETTASVAGQQLLTLPFAPTQIHGTYINGLRQSPASFSYVGNVITLPATLSIEPGDLLTIVYSH